jgi:hypothetical protein
MYSIGQRLVTGATVISSGVAHGETTAVNIKRQAPANNEVE